jgi:hypothetical protein
MTIDYADIELLTESDVEQKFVYRLLTQPEPVGLGYTDFDFRTKTDIRKLQIDKGAKRKLYYPDYAIIVNGIPSLIIEAKTPKEDVSEAFRQARLYATEINASYPKMINPCERIIVTDGTILVAGFWDQDDPEVSVTKEKFVTTDPSFFKFIEFCSKKTILANTEKILSKIKSNARYFKPLFMLGGKSVISESIGDNSFGSNVSIEYKYLFNPDSAEDRKSIIESAYVTSKRKQSHVTPIDKIIRASIPQHILDARSIQDTSRPTEIISTLTDVHKIKNELCILIGSVGSGKSTFTDYLRLKALPDELKCSTSWENINLNKAPLTKELIYDWIVTQYISAVKLRHTDIDFDHLETLQFIYSKELESVKKGRAALYPEGSEKYLDALYSVIENLQSDNSATLSGIIDHLYTKRNILPVIVLDNCDKRSRDDQLLMFDVASWLKSTFPCMVFLPIRDITYDRYRNEPPLDTVIKDLVFRIDPPRLEKVIYMRLNYALRQINDQHTKFTYNLPNGIKVECSRDEIAIYLQSIVSSLFQDGLFKRIITGLAGRNIRKGLEILLDFCKSGHLGEDEILKVRQSSGEHKIASHLISRILFKGKRKYYDDSESHIKNLFHSESEDSLPNPFARIAILQWMKNNFREYGPNRTKGYHKLGTLIQALQSLGHPVNNIKDEISQLIVADCINSESQSSDISSDDLISISPSGFIHLDLLRNINYLSTVAEDTFFRENQPAKEIADNIIGRGRFHSDSRQTAISNSKILIDYMQSYHTNYFLGAAKVIENTNNNELVELPRIAEYVSQTANNDKAFNQLHHLEQQYPPGSQIEAQITSIQPYGLFVEFGLNGNGLIHKSNFNKPRLDPLDSCEDGDWVIVEIIKFNSDHKRFELTLIDV